MTTPLLATKLYIPSIRPLRSVVPRPRLIEQLFWSLRHSNLRNTGFAHGTES